LHTPVPTRNTEAIKRLTELLIEAAKPKRIIMFGSEARARRVKTATSTSW